MSTELEESIKNLLDYFELEDGEWPMVTIFEGGIAHRGIISDDLYQLLIDLYQLYDTEIEDV